MRAVRRPLTLFATLTALAVPAAALVLSSPTHGNRTRAVVADASAAPTPTAPVRRSPTPRAARQRPVVSTAPRPRVHPRRATVPRPAPKPRTVVARRVSGGDNYPYRSASSQAHDAWGFTVRQCVSFAAWRLAQHGHTIRTSQGWGSALSWDDTARRRGVSVSSRASVGAVAQWHAGEGSPYYGGGSRTPNGTFTAGGFGHVGWVKAVYSDGSALIEQYNLNGERNYSVMRVKAPRYLHF